MIDHHTLEDFIDVLLIQSLLQGIRGQFDRTFHLSQCLFDLQIPDLFRSFQTLICKTRASLLQEGKALCIFGFCGRWILFLHGQTIDLFLGQYDGLRHFRQNLL